MKVFAKMIADGLTHYATDAKGRPEIKNVLGIASIVGGGVYLFVTRDLAGCSALMGAGLALLGLTTYGDAQIDKTK